MIGIKLRKRTQQGLFLFPGLPDSQALPTHAPPIVSATFFEEILIECFKRGYLWNGNEEISA